MIKVVLGQAGQGFHLTVVSDVQPHRLAPSMTVWKTAYLIIYWGTTLLKKRWGTNVILHTSQSLMRLRAVPLFLNNAYYDSTKKETIEVLDTFNILAELKIIKRKVDG